MFEVRRAALPVAVLSLFFGWVADAQVKRPTIQKPAPDTRLMRPVPGATWVRTGFFNEIDQTQKTSTTINEPGFLRFIWGTSLASDEGFWRLRRKVAANQFSLLATGIATQGKGGRFDIDLRPYLPTSPPLDSALYHLEVVARKKSPAQELGAWSAPVQITYGINQTPPTTFDIGDVYRKATLVLDKIVVVADQDGPGEEEYRVRGFVQELQRSCTPAAGEECPFSKPLVQRRFGPFSRDLNPPGEAPFGWRFDASMNPPLVKVNNSYEFPLGTGTNHLAAPRRFVLSISLIEEDAGSSIDDWDVAMGELSGVVADGSILGLDEDDLTEFLSDHAEDAIRYVSDGVQVVAASVDAGEAAPIVGTAVAAAAFILVPIFEDMADDYYGTGATYLTLASNKTAEIHKLAGGRVGTGAQRKYVLKPQTLRFKGPPASNSATSFDGVVDVEFHWEFSDIAQQ